MGLFLNGPGRGRTVQPFSQKSLTATVPKVFQIGLCGVEEADLELFGNSWSAGYFGRTAVTRVPLW